MNATAAPGPSFRDRLSAAWARLRGGSLSPGRAAASIGTGLFVGCSPFYGVHSLIVLAICIPLRLDAAIAYVAAHVSNPLTGPILFLLELQVGSLVVSGHLTRLSVEAAKQLGFMSVGGRLLTGWLVVGPLAALIGSATTWVLTSRVRDARDPERARARQKTRARYDGATRPIRWYVRIKLWTDPALDSVARLPGSFGRVVDAGCGYGHVGLGLLDQGKAVTLLGIELDRARLDAAAAAARGDARFEHADLRTAAFPDCDTVLLIDALHYLPAADQRQVVARAAAALTRGGRIVVREVPKTRPARRGLTEKIERRAARRRGQGDTLTFQSADNLVAILEAAGLSASIVLHDEWTFLDHVLVIGEKRDGMLAAPGPTSQDPS